WADAPSPGTLGHSADGLLPRLSLLMPAFALPAHPRLGSPAASPAQERSPTHPSAWTVPVSRHGRAMMRNAAASVSCLSPVTLSARDHLTSELLRTLSRVAASEPTSWLSGQPHILSYLARTSGP